MKTWPGTLFGLWLLAASGFAAAPEWQLYRAEGRDYVSLDNVAKFYEFPNEVPPASQIPAVSPLTPQIKKVVLEKPGSQMEVTANSREITINGVRHWLGFPVRVQDEKLLVSRLDLAKTIEPMLRPELISGLDAVKTVVLDPGHGGFDKGAVGLLGLEKNFALDVCLRAKKLLEEKGLAVVLTRQSDVFVPLEQRPIVANRLPHSIFVSVHFNDSMANHAATGFEIFSCTPRGEPSTTDEALSARDLRSEPGNAMDGANAALSASVYHSLLGNIPQVDRGVKKARFAVLRLSTVPAILIEGGFVSNFEEIRLIFSPAYRQKLADAIVNGISNYKNLAETKQRPRVVAEYRQSTPSGVKLREAPSVVTTQPAAETPKSN